MKVKKIEILATCNECGSTEFYVDDNSNYWCTDCGEPHQSDDFDLMSRLIEGNLDIDFEEIEEEE